jgi:hypothetical protein
MMTTAEARAHVTIIDTLALVLSGRVHHSYALSVMWKPLESFAPRCNCGLVLRFGPWLNGTRVVCCRCGATHWESKIWQGVPAVELAAHARR